MQIPKKELKERITRFRDQMNGSVPDWDTAIIIGKINLYYFTGTKQDGLLIVRRDDSAVYWVYRSYERACSESLFPDIRPMNSFREAAAATPGISETAYLETSVVPYAMIKRLQKYFPFTRIKSLDSQISYLRSVKSPLELGLMEQSGQIHRHVYEDLVPDLLKEGMSETDLAGAIYSVLLREGHQGTTHFSMFEAEIPVGQVAFGESSIYPTNFNGPGGNYGMSPAVPFLGNRKRLLKRGDLVFIDVGCGVEGYHTDKTITYMFGEAAPDEAIVLQRKCEEIEICIARKLKPGAIPSQIYESIIGSLSPDFLKNFMGFEEQQVHFLGHAIGLTVDENPVIAKGFDGPLQEGMVFAIEPKKGIPHFGMVGIENTFVVTAEGGRSITGNKPGLCVV